jgi:hypothetical protein
MGDAHFILAADDALQVGDFRSDGGFIGLSAASGHAGNILRNTGCRRFQFDEPLFIVSDFPLEVVKLGKVFSGRKISPLPLRSASQSVPGG